jgi:hypothetical protein
MRSLQIGSGGAADKMLDKECEGGFERFID